MGAIQQWFRGWLAQLKKNKSGTNKGQQAEDLAAAYLTKRGLRLLHKNYQTRLGEIDLVMKDQACVVFVEVRFRSNHRWADAAESVTRQKQQKLIKAAKQYIQQHQAQRQPHSRFDVVAIDAAGDEVEVEWYQHAFY